MANLEIVSRFPKRFPLAVVRLSLMALAVGSLASYGTMGFRYLCEVLPQCFYSKTGGSMTFAFAGIPAWQLVTGLTAAGVIIGCAPKLLRFDRFQNPADVIIASHEGEAKIPVKEGAYSAIFSAFAIGMGAPVGRYGPAVHLGASIGSWLGQCLRMTRRARQTLLGCGVASAISASFDAPIAGVIFAHEVIIGHYSLRAFAPITIASVLGNLLPRLHDYEFTALRLGNPVGVHGAWDHLIFALIGLIGALVSIGFMQSMLHSSKWIKKSPLPHWSHPALAGLIAGLVGIKLPQVLGLGDEVIFGILSQTPDVLFFSIGTVITLLVAKLVVTSLAIGCRIPGGVFAPSLFLGAMLGAAIALICGVREDYQVCVLVGMGAVISSVVGAPISTILIVFELTRNYDAATAVMIGVVVANAFVTRTYARSYFHRQIRLSGIDLDRGMELRNLEGRTIGQIMRTQWLSVSPNTPLSVVEDLICRHRNQDLYVIDSDGHLEGKIEPVDLLAERAETAGEISREPGVVFSVDESVAAGLEVVGQFAGNSLPVVESLETGKLAGIVTENDFVRAYNDAVIEARDERRGYS
ncbi:MAG: chloride channel protein [Verrucomicrobiota bacterium]